MSGATIGSRGTGETDGETDVGRNQACQCRPDFGAPTQLSIVWKRGPRPGCESNSGPQAGLNSGPHTVEHRVEAGPETSTGVAYRPDQAARTRGLARVGIAFTRDQRPWLSGGSKWMGNRTESHKIRRMEPPAGMGEPDAGHEWTAHGRCSEWGPARVSIAFTRDRDLGSRVVPNGWQTGLKRPKEKTGAACRNRTGDLQITKLELYQLS